MIALTNLVNFEKSYFKSFVKIMQYLKTFFATKICTSRLPFIVTAKTDTIDRRVVLDMNATFFSHLSLSHRHLQNHGKNRHKIYIFETFQMTCRGLL